MKKLLLLLLTVACTTALMAQPSRQLAPMKAGKSDIILIQPEGTLYTYLRQGGCTDVAYGGFFSDFRQDGKFARVVVSPDKKTAYFQNIISRAATGAWVKGSVEDGKVLIPLGQMYYWFEDPVNPETNQPEAPYGMRIAEISMNGSHSNYNVKTTGNAVFRIEDDWAGLVMENTGANLETDSIVGLGLVYTDKYEGEWSYYMDYETVYTKVEDAPVTPPEGLVTERYALTNGIYGHFVNVAFARGEVYISGVSESYVPTAWMKGTLDEENNRITFPLVLGGSYQTSLYYFMGVDLEKRDDYYGGRYNYKYNPERTEIVFDYDPETRSFWSNDRGLMVSSSKDSVGYYYECFPKPMFRPYTEKAATPAAPEVLEIDNRFWAWGYNRSSVAISVPCMDEDGNYLDPEQLFYALYVDDDEPYLFYQDEYPGLPFDAVEEIPYLYSLTNYIYPKSLGLWIFQDGFERMGIKSIYYGGGERHETPIYYLNLNGDDSSNVPTLQETATTPSDAVYDLAGRRVTNPTKGLYIINGKKIIK